jgi:hypothetical protein
MAVSWTQGNAYHNYASSTQTIASATVPSEALDGLDLSDVASVILTVAAATSQTFSGAGSFMCYMYDATIARWGRCPELDYAVTVSSVRDIYSGEFQVAGGRGRRIAWIPTSTVTVSGGTTVVVTVLASRKLVQP